MMNAEVGSRTAEVSAEGLTLLLELKGDGIATLHVLLAGQHVMRQFIGRLTTIREVIFPRYQGCELRECAPLKFQQTPKEAWETASPASISNDSQPSTFPPC
jgi:hypothetical protein